MVDSFRSSEKFSSGSAAIVTLRGTFNYGNLLQKYAVQATLRARGIMSTTLECRQASPYYRFRHFVGVHLLKRDTDPEARMSKERLAQFASFASAVNLREVTRIAPDAVGGFDWYISGSDQVWNPDYLDRFRSTFLPFAPPERRIALAASFGVSEIPKKCRAEYASALSSFARISVREEAGADIVESLVGSRPPVLCDPTLAIPREEWERVADDSLNPQSPYVFAYLLGSQNAWQSQLLDTFASRNHAGIVRLSDRDDGSQLPAGPAEFIALIAGAHHVVTDSFHCALFAALFERPLTIVQRQGGGPSMFSRLETLSSKLGLEGKVVEEGGEADFDAASDYSGLASRLAQERAAFDAYLDEALGLKTAVVNRPERKRR